LGTAILQKPKYITRRILVLTPIPMRCTHSDQSTRKCCGVGWNLCHRGSQQRKAGSERVPQALHLWFRVVISAVTSCLGNAIAAGEREAVWRTFGACLPGLPCAETRQRQPHYPQTTHQGRRTVGGFARAPTPARACVEWFGMALWAWVSLPRCSVSFRSAVHNPFQSHNALLSQARTG
jgi:hypothetical protein